MKSTISHKGLMMSELSTSQSKNIEKLQKLADQGLLKRRKIISTTSKKYTGKVHDIQVSNTNCYQLNNVFSSNSAGGSLVCYLLGIHHLDPMPIGLSSARFLSPSRGGYMLKVTMEE